MLGNGSLFLGQTAHYVGTLAVALERLEEADGFFERAAAMHARMRSEPWQLRTQSEFAHLAREWGEVDRQRGDPVAIPERRRVPRGERNVNILRPGSFERRLRDELLNGEIFYRLVEAKVLIERWRQEYNTFRPHSSLGYRPPAPEATQWPPPASASLRSGEAFGLT